MNFLEKCIFLGLVVRDVWDRSGEKENKVPLFLIVKHIGKRSRLFKLRCYPRSCFTRNTSISMKKIDKITLTTLLFY